MKTHTLTFMPFYAFHVLSGTVENTTYSLASGAQIKQSRVLGIPSNASVARVMIRAQTASLHTLRIMNTQGDSVHEHCFSTSVLNSPQSTENVKALQTLFQICPIKPAG